MGSKIGDYGMKMGQVVFDKETNRARITQKIAGVDVKDYIDGIKESKLIFAKPLEDKIATIDQALISLDTFKTKLQTLQSLAAQMANPISNTTIAPQNVFNQKNIMVNTSDAAFEITDQANTGSFSMTINQLASNDLRKFMISSPNTTSPLGINGTFTIGTTQAGTTQTVTLTNAMTLLDIQEILSNMSETTQINAELIQTSIGATNNTYELKLKAQNTGHPIVLKNTSGTPLSALGLNSLPAYYQAGIIKTTNEETALNLTGTLTLQSSGGTAAPPLSITSTMSLTDIVNAINSQTTTTGVQASYDRVYMDSTGTNLPQFQLKLTTVDPGTLASDATKTMTISDTGGVISALQLNSPVTDYESLIAKIVCDGTFLTSQSNIIDGSQSGTEIIPGVTITLTKASGLAFTGEIVTGKMNFADTFGKFIEAYNDLVSFYTQQTQANLDPSQMGKAAEGADLFGNRMVQNVFKNLKYNLVGSIQSSSLPLTFTALSQIGYKLQNDGTLDAVQTAISNDTATYLKSLTHNFSDIEKLFSNTVTNSNSQFTIQNLPNNFTDDLQGSNMTVNMTNNNNIISGTVTIIIKGTPTICHGIISQYPNQSILTINDGSILNGLAIQYAGTLATNTSATTTASVTQGIMSKIDTLLSNILDNNSTSSTNGDDVPNGDFYRELDRMNKTKTENKVKITKIKNEAEKLGKVMEKEFTKVYEATIQLESIMSIIETFNKIQ